MAECREFPLSLVDNTCYFAAEVVFTPVLFGLALMTTLLSILVLNSSQVRKYHPSFTYLAALAVVDFLVILSLVPRYLRNSQVLHPEVTYDPRMTYTAAAAYVLRHILLHVSNWYIVLAAVVYVMRVKSTSDYKRSWTRISISRIICFVLCIASTMLNLPRFFEYNVDTVQGHCFEDSVFWDLTPTELGTSIIYTHLYQWIVLGVAYFTPFLTLLVTLCVLLCRLGCRNMCRIRTCMHEAYSDIEREFQLGKCILIVAISFLVTNIPQATFEVLVILYGEEKLNDITGLYEVRVISQTLVFCRLVIPGIVYFLSYSDFRKSMCRSLCCAADEFYEPCACVRCCACCYGDEEEVFIDSGVLDRQRANENSTLEKKAIKAKQKQKNGFFGQRKKKNEFSRWI